MDAGEDAEQRAADQHPVEMADHEVAVGELKVERGRRQHDARQAADQEHRQEAERRRASARRSEIRPPYIVASQLKNLMPVGIETSRLATAKKRSSGPAHADGEHVVRPDAQADEGDGHRGGGHELVAEQHLAREDRDHLGDHAEDRQDQDVDLRVAEEPEQVLPQERRAAVLHVEEVRPEVAVEQDHHQRRRSAAGWRSSDLHRGPEHRPDEERHLPQGHAGRAHRRGSWR